MTTLPMREVDGLAVVPREEFELLLELARRSGSVEVVEQDDVPSARELARLAQGSAAWPRLDDEPNLYSRDDVLPHDSGR